MQQKTRSRLSDGIRMRADTRTSPEQRIGQLGRRRDQAPLKAGRSSDAAAASVHCPGREARDTLTKGAAPMTSVDSVGQAENSDERLSYHTVWKKHRGWRVSMVMTLTYLIAAAALLVLFRFSVGWVLVLVHAVATAAVCAAAAWRLPCPRCGRAFAGSRPHQKVFTRTCVHCGLRLYADQAPNKTARG